MTTRSTVLSAITISDTAAHTLVTCATNVTLLVKEVNYYNAGAAATSFFILVQRGTIQAFLVQSASVATNAPLQWQGWVVMQPGDQLRAAVGAGPFHIWVSGTHLDSVAPS